MSNDGPDLQRVPQYTQPRTDIPVPEKDVIDPVAEYEHGEFHCIQIARNMGLAIAFNLRDFPNDDFKQGYVDCYNLLANMEQEDYERYINNG